MAILRHRQGGLTRVSPHQGNKRYLIPGGTRQNLEPIPPRITRAQVLSNISIKVQFSLPMDGDERSLGTWTLAGTTNTLAGNAVIGTPKDRVFYLSSGSIDPDDTLTLSYVPGTWQTTTEIPLEEITDYPVSNLPAGALTTVSTLETITTTTGEFIITV